MGENRERMLQTAPRLSTYLRVLLGRDKDVDDILQTVYVRYLERPPKGDAKEVEGWLFKVARHEALNAQRGHRRRREREQKSPFNRDEMKTNPAQQLERVEALHRVQKALTKLPLELREPLYLKVVEQLSFREISARTGQPKSTVALRVQDGLVQLNRFYHGAANG